MAVPKVLFKWTGCGRLKYPLVSKNHSTTKASQDSHKSSELPPYGSGVGSALD